VLAQPAKVGGGGPNRSSRSTEVPLLAHRGCLHKKGKGEDHSPRNRKGETGERGRGARRGEGGGGGRAVTRQDGGGVDEVPVVEVVVVGRRARPVGLPPSVIALLRNTVIDFTLIHRHRNEIKSMTLNN